MVLLFALLMASRFPLLLRTFDAEPEEEALALLRRSIATLVSLAGGFVLVILLHHADLLRLLGGERYAAPPVSVVAMLTTALVCYGIAQYAAVPLQHERRGGTWAGVLITMAAVNVLSNLLLVPAHGLVGAAAATLLAYACGLAGCVWATRRQAVRYVPVAALLQVAAGIALAAAVSAGLPKGLNWIVQLGVALAAYALVVFALRRLRLDSPATVATRG
jgi:O-antigen/teichoic acid export membrane protein